MDLEKKLSDKLTDKMAQLLHKRINTEIKRLGKTVDERLDTLRADINNDLDSLKGKVNSLTDAVPASQPEKEDKSCNLVFRKLPESANEQLVDKLNGIIKDFLKIEDVVVSSALRIPNQNSQSSVPGLVIATFDNVGDKNKVLKAKSKLFKNVHHDVFIHADQTKEERITSNNWHTIVNKANRGGNLSVCGNRVVKSFNNPNAEESDPRRNTIVDNSGNIIVAPVIKVHSVITVAPTIMVHSVITVAPTIMVHIGVIVATIITATIFIIVTLTCLMAHHRGTIQEGLDMTMDKVNEVVVN
ncbi:hypothetical protein DPMN_165357 [Dreissena polymorpha]|uniref:Uncharacterized protein n=1 Tax=Dreissena polymorpha TaxID=45954 RepID=A0A9D4IWI1_DREPO|nr:hypothetical protein DPMN_165357 [Dreissena polymorpha]